MSRFRFQQLVPAAVLILAAGCSREPSVGERPTRSGLAEHAGAVVYFTPSSRPWLKPLRRHLGDITGTRVVPAPMRLSDIVSAWRNLGIGDGVVCFETEWRRLEAQGLTGAAYAVADVPVVCITRRPLSLSSSGSLPSGLRVGLPPADSPLGAAVRAGCSGEIIRRLESAVRVRSGRPGELARFVRSGVIDTAFVWDLPEFTGGNGIRKIPLPESGRARLVLVVLRHPAPGAGPGGRRESSVSGVTLNAAVANRIRQRLAESARMAGESGRGPGSLRNRPARRGSAQGTGRKGSRRQSSTLSSGMK